MAARCDTAPNGLTRRQALAALGLDLTYTAAQGDQLFLDDGTAVLDFLGGYGATFFGHNHPALVATLRNFLERRGVVHAQASIRSVSEHLAQRLR